MFVIEDRETSSVKAKTGAYLNIVLFKHSMRCIKVPSGSDCHVEDKIFAVALWDQKA